MASRKPARKGTRPAGVIARGLLAALLLIFLVGPILAVAVYRFAPPPATYLMIQRAVEGRGFQRQWVPIERISPNLTRAVIAAEDARFCEHLGFDLEAIQKAFDANGRGGKLRGGSTISQQTAKNVFLWPQRDWVRKGLESWFTVLIEIGWGKRRIMEVYLNSVEWAPGVYGAEAGAQHWFGKSARSLTASQSARMAAILPKPLAWRAAGSGPYVRRRSGAISRNAGQVRAQGLAGCVL